MTASDKLVIVDAEKGICRDEELWMKHHLHAVLSMIEQLASPYGSQGGVGLVVDDVVCADGWKRGSSYAESASLKLDDVLLKDDLVAGWNVAAQAVLVKPIPDVLLHLIYRVAKLLRNRLTAEGFYVEVVSLGGHDKESHDRDVRSDANQTMIESGQSLNEQIRSFVGEFVSSGDEKVKSFV